MKIVTFNVNGLRARIKNGFPSNEFLEKYDPDIICLQEVRAKKDQIPVTFLPGYTVYRSIHEKSGYAGAWTFVKNTVEQPVFSTDKLPFGDYTETGRVSILDFKYFKLINSYTPNIGSRLEKTKSRMDFENALFHYIEDAHAFKPVILCGDLNVAPSYEDTNITVQAGCTMNERAAINHYEELNMIDAWRWLNADKPTEFTFFSNMYDARKQNKGMRLDHFRADPVRLHLKSCDILHDWHFGSDHTPVLLEVYE